jgi:NAD(P)-dependent dehydrogenase (short-subunit alcohol dehydrogenase family)
MDLSGEKAFVTGGGIGAACVTRFRLLGADVIPVGRTARGDVLSFDVSSPMSWSKAFQDTPLIDRDAIPLMANNAMPISNVEAIANAAIKALEERMNGGLWTVWDHRVKLYRGANLFDMIDAD